MRRAALVIVIILILIVAAVFAWRRFNPGPLDFAGGSTVALSNYKDANPTGVPASLAGADVVKRGEYLARAADCMVCHTAPGGQAYAGGLAIPLPFGGSSIRLISRLTRTPGSAATTIRNFSTPCSAASARTARGFIRRCPIRPIPT
jgi:hypothetical protein